MLRVKMQERLAMPEGKAHSNRTVAGRLARYVTPYWRRLIAVALFTMVNAGANALGPLLIGMAIDRHISRGELAGLGGLMALLLAVYITALVSRVLQTYQMGWVIQHTLARIRANIFASVQRQSLRFFDRTETGDLMSRLVNDVEVLNTVFSHGLIQVMAGLFGLAGVLIAMLALNLWLALASFLVLPAMLFSFDYFSRRARRAYRKARHTIGDVSAGLQEDIAGVKVAQAFNRTDFNRARFAKRNAANRDANIDATTVTAAMFPAMDVLSTTATGIVAGFGGFLAINGQVTVGVVVAFLAYVQQFYQPLQQLGMLYTQAQSAFAAAERIFQLIDAPVDLQDAQDAVAIGPIAGRVEFRDVSFAYDSVNLVLKGVSFVAEPGQTIALVGVTGAGKTTIANLIARFYEPSGGAVMVDGIDLRAVTAASLRRQMGIVPQNSFLFAGTIADNIRYGRIAAGDAAVTAAAELVNAHAFITSFPDGYQTVIGERGRTLSQGQRQLVAFARAVLADPRILILDEATSSVDTRTEILIQRALQVLLKGRTSFVIAHRLSTVRNADLVLVIEDGRIVERGTHAALLARSGAYADLYRRQFRDRSPDGSIA